MRASAEVLLSAVAVMALAGSPAVADEFDAYLALIRTSVAGLPPLAPEMDKGPSSTRWGLRYGYMSNPYFEEGESQHALGAGVDLGQGKGRLGLTLGYSLACGYDCGGGGLFMAGASWNQTLWTSRPGGGLRFAVGFSPSLGVATYLEAPGAGVLSAAGQVPVAAALNRSGSLVAYLTPGIGWGRLSGGGESPSNSSSSGARPMLGGGLSIGGRGRTQLSLGFQKVFIEGGALQFGAGVSGPLGH